MNPQHLARQKLARSERVVPPHAPGMRIGLFGGTFDPPHQAHLDASLLALKRLKLDRVWWLVTPGNPLKNTSGLAPLSKRLAAARALTNHPRIDVTGMEAVINTRYTYDTISWLLARCPGVHFVWIMGADNLRSFHRWQRWRGIARLVPLVVIDRLGPSLYAAASPAGQALSGARIPEHAAPTLPYRRPPAWTFVHGLKSALSSTALRALRRHPAPAPQESKEPKESKQPKAVKPAVAAVKPKSRKAAKKTKAFKKTKTLKKAKTLKKTETSKKSKTSKKSVAAKKAKTAKKTEPAKSKATKLKAPRNTTKRSKASKRKAGKKRAK